MISFAVLMHLYWKTKAKDRQGFLFGIFLVLIFTARFVIEFVKEEPGRI
ncbi:MAG: prolipoprotein diacylglyceryl transferase family protein [Odoribacter splanchnicus]